MNPTQSWDRYWQALRYILLMVGSFAAGHGWISMDQVNAFIDNMPAIVGAAVSLGTAIWGMYVKFGTRAVPIATAARPDVPTVSGATGAIEPASAKP